MKTQQSVTRPAASRAGKTSNEIEVFSFDDMGQKLFIEPASGQLAKSNNGKITQVSVTESVRWYRQLLDCGAHTSSGEGFDAWLALIEKATAPQVTTDDVLTITVKLSPSESRAVRASAAIYTDSGNVQEWGRYWIEQAIETDTAELSQKMKELLGVDAA